MFDLEIIAVFELVKGMTKEWDEETKIKFLQELTAESAIRWRESHRIWESDSLDAIAKDIIGEVKKGYVISAGGNSITCVTCGRTSFNENDIKNKYCGYCHKFHADINTGE